VGTRYCENNCPYTVRRFNFWDSEHPGRTTVSLNPDVTLRQRGVVEKCTFCVQRIRDGKENAKMAGRNVADGEIVPACAQTCPTQALVFGDLKDPHSRASILARERRAYKLLEELNTEPGVHYLARIEKGGVG
jgi:molybdopterin-containing oxidoreductase family iron-sulfur binding subunit